MLILVRLSDEDDPDMPFHQRHKGKAGKGSKRNVEALKAQLKGLLAQPLIARGVSARYPTSGSKVIIDDLLQSTGELASYVLKARTDSSRSHNHAWGKDNQGA